MKRLKLQTVLLAICLALATTLKINKATNAMQSTDPVTNDRQIEKISNDNGTKQPTYQYDTYIQTMAEYIKGERIKTKLTHGQYIKVLSDYIRDDITKYLALLIQTKYFQILTYPQQEGDDLINVQTIQWHLFSNPPTSEKQYIEEQECLLTNNANNAQTTSIRTALQILYLSEEIDPTNDLQILRLLFFPTMSKKRVDEFLSQLDKLINECSKDIITTVDQPYSILISFLEPVANQLLQENAYLKSIGQAEPQLERLALLVREFRQLYNKKQQQTQHLLQMLATTETHAEALQKYVTFTHLQNLGAKDYQQFLICYIGYKRATYLTLLLQANWNLLQFPPNIPKDNSLNFKAIGDMLLKKYPYFLAPSHICSKYDLNKNDIALIAYIVSEPPYTQTTYAEEAIKQLFKPLTQESTNDDRIKSLQNVIVKYISQKQPVGWAFSNIVLSLLGEIETQLQQETKANENTPQAEQLKEMKQLVSDFSDAYNNKLNQQAKNQNEPKKSNLQENSDGKNEENNENNKNNNNQDVTEFHIDEIEEEEEGEEGEENKLNQSMPERGILYNWDEILAENWHGNEEEDRDDNISNYSQDETEPHNDEVEEGEEEEENKLNKTTPNIQVKGIFDEYDDVNEQNTLNKTIDYVYVLEENSYVNEAEDSDDNISNYSQDETEFHNDEEEEVEGIEEEEEGERSETIEQLMQEVNDHFNKNKEQETQKSTTQKIINNLSATNKMLQIIMQILY